MTARSHTINTHLTKREPLKDTIGPFDSETMNPADTTASIIKDAFQRLDYTSVATLCRSALERETPHQSLYWWLGLAELLLGNEADAQSVWMMGIMNLNDDDQHSLDDLAQILREEANRQTKAGHLSLAWTLRQYEREFFPSDLDNILHLVQLSIQLHSFSGDTLKDWGLLNLQQALVEKKSSKSTHDLNGHLLFETLGQVLERDPCCANILQWVDVSLRFLPQTVGDIIRLLLTAATTAAYSANQPLLAAEYAQRCLHLAPDSIEVLSHLTAFYQEGQEFEQAIATAHHACEVAQRVSGPQGLANQLFTSFLLLRSLTKSGGHWPETLSELDNHLALIQAFVQQPPIHTSKETLSRLGQATFILPYIRDDAASNRHIQNQFIAVFHQGLKAYLPTWTSDFSNKGPFVQASSRVSQAQSSPVKPLRSASNVPMTIRRLKIGYVSHCFRRHSVGWLARWLIQHHDRHKIEPYGYFVNYNDTIQDSLQEWYRQQFAHVRLLPQNGLKVAEALRQDDLDIVVDLDSITVDLTLEAMACKPAPIQVTWLGWDASGLPGIDYFIADPYVLPKEADDYYHETLWRLPHTYIAVDGFEVGVPTLRREQLAIPDHATIYLSSQVGYKRHPDMVKLQLEILQNVPYSYLLIKGISDQAATQLFFRQLAEDMNIAPERLKFLPIVSSEMEHRANLNIADVVLDTYPYNGATTTLETLWMGIPLVTRVGKQFSARNSYTMMKNIGIREGIAWSDEEYVEWGVRLGTDSHLRQNIRYQLLQSRQTAPIWNGKQFAHEMEAAYQQMWVHWKANH